MTGCAADADEIVQDTFVRALERPPSGDAAPWRTRVAMNLARDRLRRRRREGYKGPFVPSPIDQEELAEERAACPPTPEARYDLAESATFAFLLALERLSARARAVLLLRDVFDWSVAEVAEALSITEANVKVVHHRARRLLEGYDRERGASDPARASEALQSFLAVFAAGDAASLEALFASDAIALQDAGGEYQAAGVTLVGPARIAQVLVGIRKNAAPVRAIEPRVLSGAPAFVVDLVPTKPRLAPRTVVACDVDERGLIRRLYMVLASRKLTRVR